MHARLGQFESATHDCGVRRGAAAAFTLVELLIALTLTSLMGACIVLMIHGVAVGTENQQDGRRHLTRAAALETRLMTQLHGARAILAAGNGYVVYWIGDEAAGNPVNKIVNLSEMCMIQLNSTQNQLVMYTKAAGTADVLYSNTTNWYTTAKSALTNQTILANNVTAFTATASNSTPTNARSVIINITLADSYFTRTVSFAVGLRAQAAPI